MLTQIIKETNDTVYRRIPDDNIIKWAERNVILSQGHGDSGPLRLSHTRWLHEPLLAFQDRSISQIVCMKATQTGGTLLGEIALQWAIANRPGSMQWFCQSDTKAMEMMEDRIKPVLKNNKAIKHLLPKDARKITSTGVSIPGCTLVVTGHSANDIQSATRHMVFVDELAHYDNSTILYQIKARTGYTSEKGNSKILVMSQAGDIDNELDRAYREGSMEQWQVPCEVCNTYFYPLIGMFSAEGIKFDEHPIKVRDRDGRYNYGKLEQVLTLDCPHCNHQHRDTPKLKQYWNAEGMYKQTNNTPLKGYKSYNWGSIHCRSWIDLIKEWIYVCELRKLGHGKAEFKEFMQKKMAQPVDLTQFFLNTREVKTDVPYDRSSWPDEYTRNFVLDVQKDRFFGNIRAYAKDGRSHQLWCGWLNTIEQVLEKQTEYNIPYFTDKTGKKTYAVIWDSGYPHRQSEIFLYCIKYNHIAIKGDTSGTKQFDHWVLTNGKKINKPRCWTLSPTRGDPYAGQSSQGRGIGCPVYIFATDILKKVLVQLRDGIGPEFLCLSREENLAFEDYNTGMYNERLVIEDKYGRSLKIPYWEKINKSLSNEAFDVEAYGLGAALMAGVEFELINNLPDAKIIANQTERK